MPEIVALISCGKSKSPYPAPAKDLYTGRLFRASRAYVEATGWPWWILSAKHGLLRPDAAITPYDLTLTTMRHEQRRAWAERVLQQVAREVPRGAKIVLLAGNTYREFLLTNLRRDHEIEIPLAGLGIGKQVAWLLHHTPRIEVGSQRGAWFVKEK